MLVLVRTVTGLERLAAAEVAEGNHRVIDVSKRQLLIESTTAIVDNPPRLADDLFLIHAAATDPGHTKQALAEAVSTLRLASAPADFAVTASFHGRRNYNRFDVEDLVGAALQTHSGGRYHSRRTGVAPPSDRVDWRVILDGKMLWVGVRPFAVPLHRRAWRRQTVTGSLHPPVAAAMARLAHISAGMRVLDPFCGAGTILLEARAIEPRAIYRGIDLKKAAVRAAEQNTQVRGSITWQAGNSARLQGPVDRIVTNPPWDVRVGIGDFRPYLREWRRVLHSTGLVVAILNHGQAAQLIEDPAWRVNDVYDVAVAGQHPRIVVASPAHG